MSFDWEKNHFCELFLLLMRSSTKNALKIPNVNVYYMYVWVCVCLFSNSCLFHETLMNFLYIRKSTKCSSKVKSEYLLYITITNNSTFSALLPSCLMLLGISICLTSLLFIMLLLLKATHVHTHTHTFNAL